MDWSALAHFALERMEVPAVVLADTAEVLLVSSAAERALGWRLEHLGKPWFDACVAPSSSASARWHFGKALAGALRSFEIDVVTSRGRACARFDANPIGRSEGLLLMLEELKLPARQELPDDYDYDVDGISSARFELRKLWRPGTDGEEGRGLCYEVLHGRSTPCPDCPLAAAEGEQLTVRTDATQHYVLTTARLLGTDAARVSVRRLTNVALAAISQARLDALAARAQLSKRERSVLGHLVDGRALEDIAAQLEISPRTVKFHQANLLQKLGADSRADLMRLVY